MKLNEEWLLDNGFELYQDGEYWKSIQKNRVAIIVYRSESTPKRFVMDVSEGYNRVSLCSLADTEPLEDFIKLMDI